MEAPWAAERSRIDGRYPGATPARHELQEKIRAFHSMALPPRSAQCHSREMCHGRAPTPTFMAIRLHTARAA